MMHKLVLLLMLSVLTTTMMTGCATVAQEGITFQNVEEIINAREGKDKEVVDAAVHNAAFQYAVLSPDEQKTAVVVDGNGQQYVLIFDRSGQEVASMTEQWVPMERIVALRWDASGEELELLVQNRSVEAYGSVLRPYVERMRYHVASGELTHVSGIVEDDLFPFLDSYDPDR